MAHAYRTRQGLLDRVPTAPPRDLNRQQRLTEHLLTARPARQQSPGRDPHDWSDALAEALNAPVLMESYGPTAADKATRDPTAVTSQESRSRSRERSPA